MQVAIQTVRTRDDFQAGETQLFCYRPPLVPAGLLPQKMYVP